MEENKKKPFEKTTEELEPIPIEFLCPITQDMMKGRIF